MNSDGNSWVVGAEVWIEFVLYPDLYCLWLLYSPGLCDPGADTDLSHLGRRLIVARLSFHVVRAVQAWQASFFRIPCGL